MKVITWKLHKRAELYNHDREGLYNSLLYRINSRLSLINQKSSAQNTGTSLIILSAIIALGALYFIFAYSTFNGLWYHKVLCGISTLIFVYLCEQTYFEIYENQIRKDLPSTIKKLTHYYNHYKGNVLPALEDTSSKCPKSNRVYIVRLKEALLKPDYEKQIERLECKMPAIWLKILCRLILFAKENGGTVCDKSSELSGEDVISNNLKRLTSIVTFINIEQSYNDAELLGMQIFVFFAPFLVIPITKWYNANLLIDMNMGDIYRSIEAQNLTTIMMIISGLGALFIHWMRKLQN